METLIAGVIAIAIGMGNYGSPPPPYQDDTGSYRGAPAIEKPMEAAPRPSSSPNPGPGSSPTTAPKHPEGPIHKS